MDWGILGHEWAVGLLKEHVISGNLRHAYLIAGPQGVGRRTLALRLAQAVNCPSPVAPGEACRTCRTCTQIERMQHPDLSVVQAEGRGGELKIGQIRELQHALALAPYEASYRIALLLRFEEANNSAANALLKTLEEPAPKVILILTAESTERLLPTIVSRCEVLRLRPLSLEQVSQGLAEQWGIPQAESELYAHLSDGKPGYALRLHEHPELLKQRKLWLDDHARILGANRARRFEYAEGIAKDRETLRGLLQTWLSFWRDVMLRCYDSASAVTNMDRESEISQLASGTGSQTALVSVVALERTADYLEKNVNTRLAIEVLMLDLPYFPLQAGSA